MDLVQSPVVRAFSVAIALEWSSCSSKCSRSSLRFDAFSWPSTSDTLLRLVTARRSLSAASLIFSSRWISCRIWVRASSSRSWNRGSKMSPSARPCRPPPCNVENNKPPQQQKQQRQRPITTFKWKTDYGNTDPRFTAGLEFAWVSSEEKGLLIQKFGQCHTAVKRTREEGKRPKLSKHIVFSIQITFHMKSFCTSLISRSFPLPTHT